MAECTVKSLINQRCKGKQHMRWTREGVHSILQIGGGRSMLIKLAKKSLSKLTRNWL